MNSIIKTYLLPWTTLLTLIPSPLLTSLLSFYPFLSTTSRAHSFNYPLSYSSLSWLLIPKDTDIYPKKTGTPLNQYCNCKPLFLVLFFLNVSKNEMTLTASTLISNYSFTPLIHSHSFFKYYLISTIYQAFGM